MDVLIQGNFVAELQNCDNYCTECYDCKEDECRNDCSDCSCDAQGEKDGCWCLEYVPREDCYKGA